MQLYTRHPAIGPPAIARTAQPRVAVLRETPPSIDHDDLASYE